jgi:hypothetical protein
MARATELTELGAPITCEWWQELKAKGHSVYVEIDDPDEEEGSGKVIAKTLTPATIHASFAELKDSHLCCGETMAEDGYGYGCAWDADLILQHATLGEITYS